MKLIPILVFASLPLLSACGGSDSTSPTGVSGAMSFGHTGGGGPFSAAGALAASSTEATQHLTQWAAGVVATELNSTFVLANYPRPGGLADLAVLAIGRMTTGVATVDRMCVPTVSVACTNLFFVLGSPLGDSAPSSSCFLESGTVTIASISSSAATGSFSGVGTCLNFTTGASVAFTVTSGSFDVPLLPSIPGAT